MTVTTSPCSRCRTLTIGGWTAPPGWQVTLDARPLTPELELLALLAGRRTYTHHVWAGELHRRTALVIRSRPAGTIGRQTVHMDHACAPTPLERRT